MNGYHTILGVDPSLASCGIAVLGVSEKGSPHLLTARVVQSDSDTPTDQRIYDIAKVVRDNLHEYRPTLIGIEGFAFNQKFQRENMGMVVGAIRAACWPHVVKHGLTWHVMRSQQAKLLICPKWPGWSLKNWEAAGYTRKFKRSLPDKGSIIAGLHTRFGIIVHNEHEADAITVAIAAAIQSGITVNTRTPPA